MAKANAAATKPCRFCREPMNPGAVYCKECKQFQTLSGRLLGGLTFSALLGTAPVIALVYAFVRDHTVVHRSEIHAIPIQCSSDHVVIGFTNAGNRPGVVSSGEMRQEAGGSVNAVAWPLANPTSKGAFIVESTKPVVETFALGNPASGPPPAMGPGKACTYRISLDVLDFGKSAQRKETFSCPCPAA